jgi:hypothetical protein
MAPLIYEELVMHECFTKTLVSVDYDTGTDQYHLFDGKKWYRWFPSDDHIQPTKNESSDEENTEPKAAMFIYC